VDALIVVVIIIVVLAIVAGIGVMLIARRNIGYLKQNPKLVAKAQMTEKTVTTPDGVTLAYGEGPAPAGSESKPPLLLIHGQAVSWRDYAAVLPQLTAKYHVYAVDCPGHGHSAKDPSLYSATAIGKQLAWFAESVIGRPVLASGHSSGGLLVTWLAANHPDLVAGIVVEDAPYFATQTGRREKTFAFIDSFSTIHDYLEATEPRPGEPEPDPKERPSYLVFYLGRSYIKTWVGKGWDRLVAHVTGWVKNHPGEVPHLFWLPRSMNEAFDQSACLQDGTGDYDLRFGDTFYTGRWFDGFNQGDTLKQVKRPTTILHTSVREERGILLGAMSDADAQNAHLFIKDSTLIGGIKSPHNIHANHPDVVVDAIDKLAAQVG
jgi:pimeloyl-ACP methyl ester carboxylesterase